MNKNGKNDIETGLLNVDENKTYCYYCQYIIGLTFTTAICTCIIWIVILYAS